MTSKETAGKKGTLHKPGKHERSYYWLNELEDAGYSAEDLLDYGANEELTLSFVAAGRKFILGEYRDSEGIDEIPEAEDMFNGPVPLLTEYIWKILADHKTCVEYTYKTELGFAKIVHTEANPLPVVSRDQILITARDWKRFLDGLPPAPAQTPTAEDPKIIGVLAYLYAKAKQTNKAYFKPNGDIKIDAVAEDIVELLSDEHGNTMFGASYSTVQAKVSAALKKVMPILKQKSST